MRMNMVNSAAYYMSGDTFDGMETHHLLAYIASS